MSFRTRVREVLGRLTGERPLPVGGLADERRLLRHVLDPATAGAVLVVGPSLSVRQVLRDRAVDVAGTAPGAPEVTVCSTADRARSLPLARWDTVVLTGPDAAAAPRLRAVQRACRPGGLVLVLEPDRGDDLLAPLTALGDVERVVRGRGRALRVVRRGSP